ncbi:epimerase [Xylanimonas oleitrophica]|uniref:Epimerase n=1 Tax=Xylanimonas oleitrophica TaxID=2607479 RepID=A0A2W5Y280_9MICO|nr:NAD-dependent epimerase/dehydratase family protein [Xylanimonas oleitrophica]PZR51644.1 epimerase [Xylanimonas oleitrophica]
MRVVVVGATGNIGTAVLRALAAEPVVSELVGVARRVPAPGAGHPYDRASWVPVDLTGPPGRVRAGLDEALGGAHAVVHLAWAVQPSHDRHRLEQVNVGGARAVVDAVLRNHVPHLVVLSSSGVYSPGPADDHAVDEDWDRDGIASSSYSVDKVATERLLDDVEEHHPHLAVTRFRPALMFQADAGPEVGRLFLGAAGARAVRLLGRPGAGPHGGRPRFPLLPFPAGFRLQALHADDAAAAVRTAVVGRHPGPFNLTTDEVLTGQDLADLLAGGRLAPVPPRLVRTGLALAWRARAVPVGEGWFDMAARAPLLDAARARRVLRWTPQHTARAVLVEVVDALLRDRPAATPALSSRERG